MLSDGIRLMVVGMVTVFGFLALLVGVMSAQAAFFRIFGDRFVDSPPSVDGEEGEQRQHEERRRAHLRHQHRAARVVAQLGPQRARPHAVHRDEHELQPQQPVHHQQEPEDQPRLERLRQPVPREDERRVDGDDGPHPVCGRRRGV